MSAEVVLNIPGRLTGNRRADEVNLDECERGDLITETLQGPALIATAAFVGVIAGGWLTAHNQKRERQQRRINEQWPAFTALCWHYELSCSHTAS